MIARISGLAFELDQAALPPKCVEPDLIEHDERKVWRATEAFRMVRVSEDPGWTVSGGWNRGGNYVEWRREPHYKRKEGTPMATKLPKNYLKFKERYRSVIDAVESVGQAVKQAGPLDEKTAQLIQLAAAASVRSEGSVHSHVRRALDAGATTEEVRHALILLTSTIGFPAVAAAMTWAGDLLEKPRK